MGSFVGLDVGSIVGLLVGESVGALVGGGVAGIAWELSLNTRQSLKHVVPSLMQFCTALTEEEENLSDQPTELDMM